MNAQEHELSDALKRLQVWRDGAGREELDTIGGKGYRPGNAQFALDVTALLTAYKAADRAARPESVDTRRIEFLMFNPEAVRWAKLPRGDGWGWTHLQFAAETPMNLRQAIDAAMNAAIAKGDNK